MLRNVSALKGFAIQATDGDLGTVDEFLFDDDHWTVRYLVVNTGNWLTGRLVLVSPISLQGVDWDASSVHVSLTRDQVEHSPDIDTDQPVSRQKEAELFQYYGYPVYWGGVGVWGAGMAPGLMGGFEPVLPLAPLKNEQEKAPEEQGDPNLHSTREVTRLRHSRQRWRDRLGQ